MLLVGHESFRGEDEPYRLDVDRGGIFGRNIRHKEILGLRATFLLVRFSLDMLEKCAGGSECLFGVKDFLLWTSRKGINLSFIQLRRRLGPRLRHQRGRHYRSHVCRN